MVVHFCNPSPWDPDAGDLSQKMKEKEKRTGVMLKW
jgi:hypothetical protein